MSFLPAFCPRADCPSHSAAPFRFNRRGYYFRRCDRLTVERFVCQACSHGFSEQTFRVNFRLKRPQLLLLFFLDRVSKVTHRQSARNHACSRTTEERHFRRLSGHCQAFHDAQMAQIAARGGLGRVFLLDELETYEHQRTHKPLTVPILIERKSGFVLDTRVGTLPARGKRDAKPSHGEGLRVSESRALVKAAFERLRRTCPPDRRVCVLTDRKTSYTQLLKELFGDRCRHLRTISTRRRDVSNPLWPINHTLARVRDNVSRLVRETWAAAKLRQWLAGQLSIWVCYRNYVRDVTNRRAGITPAMELGLLDPPRSVRQVLEWRIFPWR